MDQRLEQIHDHLIDLLEAKDFLAIKALLSAQESIDVADLLNQIPPAVRVLLFRLLPKDQAIEVFEFMEGDEREDLLAHFTDGEVAEIILDMSDDDRTELFDELPAKTVKKLLLHLPAEERTLANSLLNYPEGSTGRVMTPEFIDLKADLTAAQALQVIRRQARSKETIYTSFVVDGSRRLLGAVSLEDLILSDPEVSIKKLMDDDPVSVVTTTDQEEAAQVISRYDLQALPVVDKERRLVGIVTFDDVLDIVEEEATEDFQRMAGIEPTDEGYLDTGLFTLARKRFTWLLVCIVTQILTSSILENYSEALESAIALAFFIPLIIDTGGNAGTQSATLFIRSMTLGDIEAKDLPRVFLRETATGLLLGGAMALLAVGRVLLLGTGAAVALTVAIALVAVVLLGNLAGILLPLTARALKVDPAIMSGPFITTVVDVAGLIVYFEVARRLLVPA
ncbi:MAG: magnesium transporter [Synergistaceae bacterium]|nr:magnesium transporter [Synergistaceae bacterium]